MKMKISWWLLLAVVGIAWLTPQQVVAQSCTAARFHFICNKGCDQLNGGAGGVPPAKCPVCITGMPRWWVTEPYINLQIADEPLSYVMSSGKEMSFKWYYQQHFQMPKADEIPNWFYYVYATLTPRTDYYAQARTTPTAMTNAAWAHNWMMNIQFWDAKWEGDWTPFGSQYRAPTRAEFSTGYEALLFRPEGGMNYFYNTNGTTSLKDAQSQIQLQPLSSYPLTTNNPSSDANGIYWGDPNRGFKVVYPDGSQDVFGLTLHSTAGPSDTTSYGGGGSSSAYALLTQRIDPQGRITRVGYEWQRYTNFWKYNLQYNTWDYTAFRIRYVVDPDGRTNTFVYVPQARLYPPFYPAQHLWQLAEVDDPYGRKVQLGYDPISALPTSITDAAGLTNTFKYQTAMWTNTYTITTNNVASPTNIVGLATNTAGWITNLSTPYGNTSFSYYEVPEPGYPDTYQKRAIYVKEPEGAQQLYYYVHKADGLMASTATMPTVPGNTDFDDGNSAGIHPDLYYRNTIYWGRKQFDALSSSVKSYLASGAFSNALYNVTAGDFKKGRTRHWLWQSDSVSISDALSSEQDPSPDAAGSVAGMRTWYNYAGKPSPPTLGSNPQVTCIARVLPDGNSQYTIYNYYSSGAGAGLVSDNQSTYSKPDNSIGTLTNWFRYSTNNIDLLTVSNSIGQFVNYSYTNHAITGITNALNQVTTLTWDEGITWNLTGIQFASGESVALNIDHSGSHPGGVFVPGSKFGFATHPVWSPSGRAFTINTYSAGLPASITDDRGLSWTNIWDGLNRLTSVTFPDQTTISNIYYRLDLAATKDRLGNWARFGYDGLQHLTAVTNANNAVTTYSWCGCGSLTSILDPLLHTTTLSYDNQGNLLSILYPDSSSFSYEYDLDGRMTKVLDGASRFLQIDYNIQGLPTTVTSANGQLRKTIFDAVNRPISVTDANGITITNQYDPINELLKRTWPDNIGESYGYTAKGLLAYTNRNQQKTYFYRDGAGRVLAVTNANSEITQFGYDSLNNITNLIDGLLHTTAWQYNEYGWLTNKLDGRGSNVFRYAYNPNGWVTNRWTPAKGNAGYTYDNVGNLKSIVYPQLTINYAYDVMNRLTNMVDAVGTTAFGYTDAGRLATEDGPWASDTLSYTYVQGLRTALSLSQPSGSFSQSYAYDGMWRMTNTTSSAGSFGYAYGFQPASSLVTGISLPNGANIVNTYDALARLHQTALDNQYGDALDAYTYTPDALGLRTNIVRNLGLASSAATAAFDNIGQLTGWKGTETTGILRQNEQLGFGYDAAHNLSIRTNGALLQTFNVDNANELTSVSRTGTFTESGATPAPASSVTVNGQPAQTYGDLTFARTNLTLLNGNNTFTNVAQNAYTLLITNMVTVNLPASTAMYSDYNGSLTNDGTRTFAYDSEGQLTNITLPGQWRTDFVYDGLNRRRISIDYGWTGSSWTPTNETHYIYDGNLIIQERNASNNPLVTYTRGLDLGGGLQRAGGIGGLLARTDSSSTNFYHADGAGNITALMDASQNIVARYLYNPFGKLLGQWGKLANANMMQFSSMPQQRGIALYPFRGYEPNLQRWLNQDPIQEQGGINLLRAMNNNPLNFVDPWGLQFIEDFEPDREGRREQLNNGSRPPSQRFFPNGTRRPLSSEERFEEYQQRLASEQAMRLRGLDPNQTYIGPRPEDVKPPCPNINSVRRAAVRQAWRDEQNMFQQVGKGTREWTEREKEQLLENGKVPGYQGHHINNVADHPERAGDPNNIQFLTPREHFEVHENNWQNATSGPLVDRGL